MKREAELLDKTLQEYLAQTKHQTTVYTHDVERRAILSHHVSQPTWLDSSGMSRTHVHSPEHKKIPQATQPDGDTNTPDTKARAARQQHVTMRELP